MEKIKKEKYKIGKVVKNRILKFRGVILDVEKEFENKEEWYKKIKEDERKRREKNL